MPKGLDSRHQGCVFGSWGSLSGTFKKKKPVKTGFLTCGSEELLGRPRERFGLGLDSRRNVLAFRVGDRAFPLALRGLAVAFLAAVTCLVVVRAFDGFHLRSYIKVNILAVMPTRTALKVIFPF